MVSTQETINALNFCKVANFNRNMNALGEVFNWDFNVLLPFLFLIVGRSGEGGGGVGVRVRKRKQISKNSCYSALVISTIKIHDNVRTNNSTQTT